VSFNKRHLVSLLSKASGFNKVYDSEKTSNAEGECLNVLSYFKKSFCIFFTHQPEPSKWNNFGHILYFSFSKFMLGGHFVFDLLKFPSVIYDHKTYSRNNNKSIEL